jgi:1-acyl-sn-glycerol-3-phosphate acyltransferase
MWPVAQVTPKHHGSVRWSQGGNLVVRSIVFNLLFYLITIIYLIAALPTMLLPRHAILGVAKIWGRTSLWLLRLICGITVEWRGIDKIPKGPLLVASKHQSTWETFALIPLFADPTFIVKRELFWLPFFGWYMWTADMIPINRRGGPPALAAMMRRAIRELGRGRQIIIFPEGTRRAVGAEPAYKFGVARLYAQTGAACLPIALNSGLIWPRRSLWRHPGVVRVEILELIPPGLDPDQFFARLRHAIETASAGLIAEGAAPA